MPLSWNEIRDRAVTFARDWKGTESEQAESQSFWNEFFKVFGVPRRRVASFEQPVKALGDRAHQAGGRIDLFWKGTLLVEHKSLGKDLDRAFVQAMDYFPGISDRDLPRYVLVSDFERFRLYDLESDAEFEFSLADLPKKIKHFGFIAGYAPQEIKPQDPVNIKAAEKMGRLHDQLKASGYKDTTSRCCWCAWCSVCSQKTPASSSSRAFASGWKGAPRRTARTSGRNSRNCFRCSTLPKTGGRKRWTNNWPPFLT